MSQAIGCTNIFASCVVSVTINAMVMVRIGLLFYQASSFVLLTKRRQVSKDSTAITPVPTIGGTADILPVSWSARLVMHTTPNAKV